MRTRARRSKRFAGLLTVGLIAGLLPGFYAPAQAAVTLVVDDNTIGVDAGDCPAGPTTHNSIQLAVDAAAVSGDTVFVCPGTYDEQVVIDGKNITLSGVGDASIIRPSSPATLDTFYTYPAGVLPSWVGTVLAPVVLVKNSGPTTIQDLLIDGTDVTSLPAGASRLSGILYGESGGLISDVTLNSIKTAGYADRTYVIDVSAVSTARSVEIADNTVNDFARAAIQAQGDEMTATIHDNTITGPGTIGPANVPNGIVFIQDAVGSASNNTISAMHHTGSPSKGAGLLAYSTTDPAGVTFSNNNVSDVDDGVILAANASNVTVGPDNDLSGNGVGVQIENGATNNTVTGNSITSNSVAGIRVDGADNPNPGTNVGPGNIAHHNDITGNAVGVIDYNSTPGDFNAENNWWACSGGPNTAGCDTTSGTVDYDPWLCAPRNSGNSCVSGTVGPAGGTVTNDSGTGQPTATDTQTTSVFSPNGGPVTITESNTHTFPASPAEYTFFGQEVNISAPAASAAIPLVLTFKFDATVLGTTDPNTVVVRRSGVEVTDCAPGNGTTANPDPCVESRSVDGNGDLVIVVYTSAASPWDFLEPVAACTITGTPGPDNLVGTTGPDVICGLGGNDIIFGNGGADELHGQGDNDTLYGNDGNDDMFGGGGDDDMFGGPGGDEMYGGLGNDRMWGGFGAELFSGGDGNDLMVGRFGNDDFDGGIGDDTMLGGDGNDNFDAGEGNNDVYGGLGIDTITAGTGNDRLRGGAGPDTITAGDGNNEILAGDGNNVVTSGTGNDYVDAGLGSNTITTNGGNDSVFAGHGTNTINVGDGDNYVLSGAGPDTVTSGIGIDKIETGLGDDNVNSGGGDDALYLGGGNNTANAGDGNNYVLGGVGIDNITTGTGNDRIDAEGGDNVINAGDGVNGIFAGNGNNLITTGIGADFILAGLGADSIFSGGGNDVVFAGRGNNPIINGGAGDDYLVGGEDNDNFDGGPNTDTCDAGSLGFDTQVNCEVLVGTFP